MVDPVRLVPSTEAELNVQGRCALADAFGAVGTPVGVAIVVIGSDGKFACRTVYETGPITQFDLYARAEAILMRIKLSMLD